MLQRVRVGGWAESWREPSGSRAGGVAAQRTRTHGGPDGQAASVWRETELTALMACVGPMWPRRSVRLAVRTERAASLGSRYGPRPRHGEASLDPTPFILLGLLIVGVVGGLLWKVRRMKLDREAGLRAVGPGLGLRWVGSADPEALLGPFPRAIAS